MARFFNVSADCQPDIHYMVDITDRLKQIKAMVDAGQYFTINRARQYGKTTTLQALEEFLREDYHVVSLDFQLLGDAKFRNENVFALAFLRLFLQEFTYEKTEFSAGLAPVVEMLEQIVREKENSFELQELFVELSGLCRHAPKKIVLLIDEADSATNNQVFLDFLAQLRGYYIRRRKAPTFQSVILAGVYDIRNLKQKFASDEKRKVNSPWNIAADFLVEMGFSAKDIAGMLHAYETDHKTGMDVPEIAGLIYDYTSGYPFLVSRICKLVDERIAGSEEFLNKQAAWTRDGILSAVRILLLEKNTLFESLLDKLERYPKLKGLLFRLLFQGQTIAYNPDDEVVDILLMFGFVKVSENKMVMVANRIFETRLYDFFLTDVQENEISQAADKDKNRFIQDGHLNMTQVLRKFIIHFNELYGDREERFLEADGRRYFLLYLRPIINGSGNYYVEAQTRNMERTDVIVDYRGEQFIVELKLWRGNEYHTRGESQLAEYLDHYHLKKGYMLSFNFNKNKQVGIREIMVGDKVLVEAVV